MPEQRTSSLPGAVLRSYPFESGLTEAERARRIDAALHALDLTSFLKGTGSPVDPTPEERRVILRVAIEVGRIVSEATRERSRRTSSR